jgi:hypothetical protein
MFECGPPSLCLGRLAELWRVIRMCEGGPTSSRGCGTTKGWRPTVAHAKPRRGYGVETHPAFAGHVTAVAGRAHARLRVDAEREGRLVIGD